MPKTRDAFALRDVAIQFESFAHGLISGVVNDELIQAVGKWVGTSAGTSKMYLFPVGGLGGTKYLEFELHAVEEVSGKLQRKLERVDAHISRLKKYLDKILELLISSSLNSDDLKERTARARILRLEYEKICAVLVHLTKELGIIIENGREFLPAEFKKHFGNRLKLARGAKGLTVAQIAEMVGLSYNGYSQYERGTREPPLLVLSKLVRLLDVSADWLLGIKK